MLAAGRRRSRGRRLARRRCSVRAVPAVAQGKEEPGGQPGGGVQQPGRSHFAAGPIL